MKTMLKKMTEKWMQLERRTLEQRKEAEEFYEENLMKLIEEDYRKRNKNKVFEKVEYLIMSVGTSFEPLVLNIMLFKPRKVLLLYTEKTESTLEKVVEYCKLPIRSYQKEFVNETDPLSVYQKIKNGYLSWNKPEKIYIDFTGGTKAMSAAAALAGALIDVQLVYVGTTNFLTDFRKPEPGTETLIYIENPVSVFGDLEIEKAMVHFDQYNYTGAKEKLGSLMRKVPDPEIRQQLEFGFLLAGAYEAWDSLDFLKARHQMEELVSNLRRDHLVHQKFLMMDFLPKLSAQNEILKNLTAIGGRMIEEEYRKMLSDKDVMTALIFSLYQNARVREFQEKYDMATLLFYRQLEMIMQRRLIRYNLYASNMDYNEIVLPDGRKYTSEDVEALKGRFDTIKKNVFGRPGNHYLPDPISLLEGYILLLALGDGISKVENGNHTDFIRRIRSMVYLRNNSIFAHGLGSVGEKKYKLFRDYTIEVLRKFCELEGIDMKQYVENITWLNPLQSKYYSGMRNK